MTRLALLALFTATAGPAVAAPVTYVIDPHHSMPRFEYSHFGYSTQSIRFDTLSGRIVFDRAAKTGSVEVEIDTKSVDSGYPLFNEHLQGADFFDTARYPAIRFKSDAFKFDGDRLAAVTGQLTIKGVTRPVTLTLGSFQCMPHPMRKKDACGANASVVVKRSDFGMGKYAPYVSDDVTLHLPVEAVAE